MAASQAREPGAVAHPIDEMPDWDRTEWVGEGQDEHRLEDEPRISPREVRWSKWQWIGEDQGSPGPNRGRSASQMPEGESKLSGHNHVSSAEHWGGSGWRREPEIRQAATHGAAPGGRRTLID